MKPAAVKGIIIGYSGGFNGCKIGAVDPETGNLTVLETYNNIGCPNRLRKDGMGGTSMYFPYSPNFDKIAVPVNAAIGMANTSGQTSIVATESTPDFGASTTSLGIVGFDKQGNFYYGADVSDARKGRSTQFLRIPAGSSGPAQVVGTATSSDNFGLLPGGTIGMGASYAIPYTFSGNEKSVDGCANGGNGDNPGTLNYSAPFDPDHTGPYFYYEKDGIYKDSGYCKMQGTPITQPGPLYDDIVSSPDGSRVAVKANNSDELFVADGNGNENTIPRTLHVAPVGQGYNWFLLGWK